jgi:hypothetical protein
VHLLKAEVHGSGGRQLAQNEVGDDR